ncbi:hypothetical protein [Fodinibius sediminis]|nr:hypothetical protein [Fodinibius sediminis]
MTQLMTEVAAFSHGTLQGIMYRVQLCKQAFETGSFWPWDWFNHDA